VYAAGEAEGQLYLATRYVEGTDLRALLDQEAPLAAERALDLVGQVADALDAAHRRGLVHRDVKPGNVLVDSSDHCYLCDFGLTKQLTDGARTATGPLAGSLDYVAPEQIRRGDVDGRADQYALACVLYECLSGAPPFRHETEAQTLWAHMQEEPAPLRDLQGLDPVLGRALAKEPAERYESCDAFVEDARAALRLGPSPTAVRRRRMRLGRRLLLAGAALVAAAAVAAVLALVLGGKSGIVAPPNSVAAIDPVTRKVVAAIPVGDTPTAVAADEDWVWVINANDGVGTISRIDTDSKQLVATFSVAGTPVDLLAAAGSLWVGTHEGRVFRIEPSLDTEEESWQLPNAGKSNAFVFDPGAGFLALGAGDVWAASFRAISRIDPTSSRLVPSASPLWGPFAFGFRSLWVTGTMEGLARLDPVTMRRRTTIDLPFAPGDVTTGAGSVWLPDDDGRRVWRIDPVRNVVQSTYDVGGSPNSLAVSDGAVWGPTDEGSVVRIDPAAGTTEGIGVGGATRGVAVGSGLVWVSVG
jgi:YVTN family beta-propeller protein